MLELRRMLFKACKQLRRGFATASDVPVSDLQTSSTCKSPSRFKPNKPSAQVLRHLRFTVPQDYKKGLDIQESFTSAFLQFKKMARKIDDGRQEMDRKGLVSNDYEKQLLKTILEMKPSPTVLSFQFNNIFTAGRREKYRLHQEDIERLKATGYDFYQADRGGEITFHNIGQLVVYPIVDLKDFNGLTVRCFVNLLEDSVIKTLDHYGIKSKRTENTGVWVDDKTKISSIGLQVRRNVTSHGISLNVSNEIPQVEQSGFVFCGLKDKNQTSMKALDVDVKVEDVATQFVRELAKNLGIEQIETVDLEGLDLDNEVQ